MFFIIDGSPAPAYVSAGTVQLPLKNGDAAKLTTAGEDESGSSVSRPSERIRKNLFDGVLGYTLPRDGHYFKWSKIIEELWSASFI